MRTLLCSTLACMIMACSANAGPSSPTRLSAPEAGQVPHRSGWWIRFKMDRQEALSTTLWVGTSSADSRFLVDWQKGKSTAEVEIPKELATAGVLWVKGQSNPEGRNSWFCIMYGTRGVKHMDFDKSEDQTVKPTDDDGECNF